MRKMTKRDLCKLLRNCLLFKHDISSAVLCMETQPQCVVEKKRKKKGRRKASKIERKFQER